MCRNQSDVHYLSIYILCIFDMSGTVHTYATVYISIAKKLEKLSCLEWHPHPNEIQIFIKGFSGSNFEHFIANREHIINLGLLLAGVGACAEY